MSDRYLLKLAPSKQSPAPSPLSVNMLIAITDDGRGVAVSLQNELQSRGYKKAQVVQVVPAASDAVIVLDGLAAFANVEDAIACNHKVFLHARRVAERFTQRGGVFITVQATGGMFSLNKNKTNNQNCWSAGIAALTKTAAQEWPKATCQAIDVAFKAHDADKLAKQIADQLLAGSHDLECGISADGAAMTVELQAAETTGGKLDLGKNPVILATGGARGITAACLLALVKQAPSRIILLGRTKLDAEENHTKQLVTEADIKQGLISHFQTNKQAVNPAVINQQVKQILAQREVNATIAALQSAGAEVMYLAADILNVAELTHALSGVRKKWGNITGVLHGAGVLADKLISQKSDQQFDLVFNTKVVGLKNLLFATEKDDIKLLLLFSSVAARFGNVGQCDYAMANDILNKVAQQVQYDRGDTCLVKSYNWGPWESGMVTPQLKALFEQRGVSILPIETGTRLFVDELMDGSRDHVEVVFGGRLDNGAVTHHYKVSAATHPFLTSHVVNDVPVVPACLVLEWFVQSARGFNPKLTFITCRNFKVLRGITLANYYDSEDEFQVMCELNSRSASEVTLTLRLLSESGVLHYAAEVVLSDKMDATVLPQATTLPTKTWPWPVTDIYQNESDASLGHRLFHGKDLQAIATLEGFSDKGGTGKLYTMQQKALTPAPWRTDLVALDGVLQLLRLWSFTQLNYPTLPTKIEEFTLCDVGVAADNAQLTCHFDSDANGKYRTVSNAVLKDANGKIYGRLKGVEMCAIQIN